MCVCICNGLLSQALLQEGEADAFHVSGAGRTALMEACVEGHVGVVHILLTEAGVDIRQVSTTLHHGVARWSLRMRTSFVL